ncbi:type II toxin-antitoxin system PemK/MazF family toxin [Corynebacterium sp. 320]|nr:type II toxin-antitoxin system PemK/MazF family toxin [Corynebacterium sp. 321]KAB1502589.1 type II toxin-antitoxin system PemK/MazF family toxin [Corynebacterium sp. 320]KAB1551996.1 type II toxin-antitoxin system PemK/MazF family toxin [Corynebacterium sp. 319]KAB3526196.1 type II toxin-antitoxin system PemK/MazF family toxin [Corynebacterium sp. 250]KAB3538990.1 type II toxin-antitoxin system PemK/MazF family toxin [Corynebacterium sp. 366]QNP93164.1 type II toxin-antitoxin system PemK/M
MDEPQHPHHTDGHFESTTHATPGSEEDKRSPGGVKNWLACFVNKHFRHRSKLDEGLQGLEAQLGLSKEPLAHLQHLDVTLKRPTRELARTIIYAPDMDGQAEPGEVVWANLRFDKVSAHEQRAVLLIGRNNHTLLGLLISSHSQHANEHNWLPIGSGPWNDSTPESWIRVDKTLLIPETFILRRGTRMPERRFERIAARLREDYGWK